jgi:hypothetical protein
MAYKTSDNSLFKLKVCMLKSPSDHGAIKTSNNITGAAVETKYTKLVKLDK